MKPSPWAPPLATRPASVPLRALVGGQRVAAAAARLGLAARALAAEVGALGEGRSRTRVAVVAADRLTAHAMPPILWLPLLWPPKLPSLPWSLIVCCEPAAGLLALLLSDSFCWRCWPVVCWRCCLRSRRIVRRRVLQPLRILLTMAPACSAMQNKAARATVPTGERALRRTAGARKRPPARLRAAALVGQFEPEAFRPARLRLLGLGSQRASAGASAVGARFGVRVELFGERRRVALEHLRHDVDALRLQIGFFGRAGDVDLDRDRDFRVKRDLHLVHADRLDRAVEHDLALGDVARRRLRAPRRCRER